MRAYIDVSSESSSSTEYSIHGLSLEHMKVLMYAVKTFGGCMNEDFDALADKIQDLTSNELNLLVDAASFRKASNELNHLLSEMD